MTRSHAILAGLLVLALAWAFALTQSEWWPAQSAERPIPLWSVEGQDIARVEYVEGASKVVLKVDPSVRLPDGSAGVWIEAEGLFAEPDGPNNPVPPNPHARPVPPPAKEKRNRRGGAELDRPRAMLVSTEGKPAGPAPQAASVPNAKPVAHVTMRGGVFAARILKELGHVTALRDLGRPTETQRATFGLAKPLGYLRIERTSGEALTLDLGAVSVGAVTRYGMMRSGDKAYLVNLGLLRNFEHPRRLMDREWVPFALSDAKQIEAKIGAKKLTVYQLDLPRSEVQRWSRTPGAAKGEADALKWVQALMGVKVLDYGDAKSGTAKQAELIEITVLPGEPKAAPNAIAPQAPAPANPVTLTIFKPDAKDTQIAQAVSGYTVSPVSLSLPAVQAIVDQARALLGSK